VRLSEKVRAASKCGPLESDARDVGKNTWGLSTGPIIMVQFEGQLRLGYASTQDPGSTCQNLAS
jgi:hypothetical protein